jgi:Zn finger protein HypA/HybF involved in hydrogenase expression
MHEFGLGEEVVKAVLEEMKRLAPPPHSLRSARGGALRRVAPDHLRFAYEVLTRDTPDGRFQDFLETDRFFR